MKKSILLLFLLLNKTVLFSQSDFKYGFKSGVNLAGFHTKDRTISSNIGYNLGVVSEINLNNTFSIQPEILISKKGGDYEFSPSKTSYIYPINYKLTYINIPINAKLHITKKFCFNIVPEFGFMINSKTEQNNQKVEYKKVKNFDYGIGGGLSYDFNNGIFMQSRYTYGLNQLFIDREYYTSCISLSLGYFIKK